MGSSEVLQFLQQEHAPVTATEAVTMLYRYLTQHTHNVDMPPGSPNNVAIMLTNLVKLVEKVRTDVPVVLPLSKLCAPTSQTVQVCNMPRLQVPACQSFQGHSILHGHT